MTDKELKRLKRSDLLRLLVDQSRQMEALKAEATATEQKLRDENQQLYRQLEEQQLTCTEAGSLADAAVHVNGVFEAAQKAADQYLENIRRREAEQDARLNALEAERRAAAERMLAEAELTCAEKRTAAEQECAAMRAKTEELCDQANNEAVEKIDAYWQGLRARLDDYYDTHEGLREQLVNEQLEPEFSEEKKLEILLED